MIGNVFLLFLGIVLQVNVLASHLTLQLNSNQPTGCTIWFTVEHQTLVIWPQSVGSSGERLSPTPPVLTSEEEGEYSYSFTFDYFKSIHHNEDPSKLKIILRNNDQLRFWATDESSRRQLKELYDGVYKHNASVSTVTEDDEINTRVSPGTNARPKWRVLPPPRNKISPGKVDRKKPVKVRNPLFQSPATRSSQKSTSNALDVGVRGSTFESESPKHNESAEGTPVTPKKRDGFPL